MRCLTPACAIVLCLVWCAASAGWTGRRAVLYAEATVMLQENAPWVRGKTDCSGQMFRLLNKVFPELRTQKWFKRTTADAMGYWPWEPLMSLIDVFFGDLLFTGRPNRRHIMMTWTDADLLIHASKKFGFTMDWLRPYWAPKIELVVRPPY